MVVFITIVGHHYSAVTFITTISGSVSHCYTFLVRSFLLSYTTELCGHVIAAIRAPPISFRASLPVKFGDLSIKCARVVGVLFISNVLVMKLQFGDMLGLVVYMCFSSLYEIYHFDCVEYRIRDT
jgi:hypothetical protein